MTTIVPSVEFGDLPLDCLNEISSQWNYFQLCLFKSTCKRYYNSQLIHYSDNDDPVVVSSIITIPPQRSSGQCSEVLIFEDYYAQAVIHGSIELLEKINLPISRKSKAVSLIEDWVGTKGSCDLLTYLHSSGILNIDRVYHYALMTQPISNIMKMLKLVKNNKYDASRLSVISILHRFRNDARLCVDLLNYLYDWNLSSLSKDELFRQSSSAGFFYIICEWISKHGYIPNTVFTSDPLDFSTINHRPHHIESHKILLPDCYLIQFAHAIDRNNYKYAKWLANQSLKREYNEYFGWDSISLQNKYKRLFDRTGWDYQKSFISLNEDKPITRAQEPILIQVILLGAKIRTNSQYYILDKVSDQTVETIINRPEWFEYNHDILSNIDRPEKVSEHIIRRIVAHYQKDNLIRLVHQLFRRWSNTEQFSNIGKLLSYVNHIQELKGSFQTRPIETEVEEILKENLLWNYV